MLFYQENFRDIVVIIEALQEDSYAVQRVLTELTRLIQYRKEIREEMAAYHILDKLYDCIKRHDTSYAVLLEACLFFQNVIIHESKLCDI